VFADELRELQLVDAETREQRASFMGESRMLILASILAIFVYGMIAATLGTLLPDLSARFGLTPSQNGRIAFFQAMGLFVASLLVGPLMDTRGVKTGLVMGLALAAIALAGLPRAGGFGPIAALMFVLGWGGGTIVTGANALASAVSEAHRATTLNLVNLFFGLGGMATPLISANLLKKNSGRLCYLMSAITVLTLVIHLATTMPPATGVQSFVMAQVGPVLGRPVLFLLALFLFLYVACEVGVWNWLSQHLIAQGIAESRALNILSLGFALGLLVGRMAVSPILINIPATTVLLTAAVCMAITTWSMLRTDRPRTAGLLVFLAGASMAPVFPTTLAVAGDVFPRMASTALGIVVAAGWLGLAVSSRIIGAIAGGEPRRLRKALLVIPLFSVIMIGADLAIRSLVP
jgi:fucose permease